MRVGGLLVIVGVFFFRLLVCVYNWANVISGYIAILNLEHNVHCSLAHACARVKAAEWRHGCPVYMRTDASSVFALAIRYRSFEPTNACICASTRIRSVLARSCSLTAVWAHVLVQLPLFMHMCTRVHDHDRYFDVVIRACVCALLHWQHVQAPRL